MPPHARPREALEANRPSRRSTPRRSPGGTASRKRLIALSLLGAVACSESDPIDPIDPNPDTIPEGALELVVDGLDRPVHLSAPAGDTARLFVVEQPGRIKIVRGGSVLATPFLDLSAEVSTGGERGLLSVAFHPNHQSNGYFYVNYTDADGDTQVVRYTVSSDPDVADESSALPVLTVQQPNVNHNGGQLAFGPDGMLYVGMGDGGGSGDPLDHGQRPETLLGSILRIDVDAGSPYAIPADNPFVGSPDAAPETWAYGLRNPWRFSFDRQTGDLYIADVGQAAVEEIDFQPATSDGGQNYGWSITEGSECFDPATGCDRSGLVLPIHEYNHPDGCSVTGGFVYRGSLEPSLVGRYFFADYCRTWIRSFVVTEGAVSDLVDHTAAFGQVPSITSFGEDGVGELYVVSHDGEIYRIVAP